MGLGLGAVDWLDHVCPFSGRSIDYQRVAYFRMGKVSCRKRRNRAFTPSEAKRLYRKGRQRLK
jgi:hypothetical protein